MSPQRKELDLFQRGQIIGAWKCGATIRTIAQTLNHPPSTVGKVIKTYDNSGYKKPPPRKGRPHKMTDRDDRALRKVLKENRKANIEEMRDNFMTSTSTNICEKTIRRHLHESGYHSRVGVRKPYINNINRKKRLGWVKERKAWTNEWENVVWSDE